MLSMLEIVNLTEKYFLFLVISNKMFGRLTAIRICMKYIRLLKMILRRSQKSLFMVCPTQQQTRIMEWMESHLEGFKSVSLQDKTSMFTIMTLVGPKAKDMMTEICETEVDMQPFTFRFFNMRFLFSLHSPHFFGLFFVMLSFFF